MTEFDRVIECMRNNTESIFTEIEKGSGSYWEDKNNDYPCVLEYMFDTPVDMMNLMGIYIEDAKLQRMIVSDSFKKRTEFRAGEAGGDINRNIDVALPEYVYVF